MKKKIQIIRMICGMLREKNTGIILCEDSKRKLSIIRGKRINIALNIASAMHENENLCDILTTSVLAFINTEGFLHASLNESALVELKEILEKTIAEGGAR